ncbi:MAG: histidine phosphatase family protein, partial [Gammaproteobacteria bacterium]|nr:histidine phosphatase family protein [Gammaproteobacteria bacterium]
RPPGAEALSDFQSRIVSAWTEVISQNQYEHVLVVGHAGMMRMIISHVLRMPIDAMFRIDVPNAGITRIRIDGEGEQQLPRLVFHAGNLA